MSLHADTLSTLSGWQPTLPAQRSLREAFLGFLAARPDACARACEPGHITASALVLSASGSEVLLTLHPRVGAWLQLGGHCEPTDTTLAGAALREATEESGISGLTISPVPVHVDVHPITCSGGRGTRPQRRVPGPALVAGGRTTGGPDRLDGPLGDAGGGGLEIAVVASGVAWAEAGFARAAGLDVADHAVAVWGVRGQNLQHPFVVDLAAQQRVAD